VTLLPNTTKEKERGSRLMPAVLGVAALALLLWVVFGGRGFEPGEEVGARGIKDIAVSEEDTLYPPSDVLRFGERPGVIYVYVTAEGLPAGTDLEARVERSGWESLLSRLLSGSGPLEVVDEQEEQLGPSEGGVSGVVKFALGTESGEPVPPGNYTVSIHRTGNNVEDEDAAARKTFVVRD
jgi:hypothetical protein